MMRAPNDLADIYEIKGGERRVWSCVFDPSEATPISSDAFEQPSVSDFFDFSPSVIQKGQKVFLENRCLTNSSDLLWMVSGDHSHYLVSGTSEHASSSLAPDVAGVYSVSQMHLDNPFQLTSDKKLYVCNAVSGQGLRLNEGASFSFANPCTSRSYQFVFDWWMKADKREGFVLRTSESADFFVSSQSDGSLNVSIGGKSAKSSSDFVLADGWHHYALVFYYGKVFLYRDGNLFGELSGSYSTSFSAWNSDVRVEGSGIAVDEFRCWKKNVKADMLRQICVAPLEDVSGWESADKGLWAYFSFEEPSGSASDRTSAGHNAAVSGNAERVPSDGVFCLDFGESQGAVENVSSSYLTNYKAPFLHTEESVNAFDPNRFYALEHGTERSAWEGDFMSDSDNGVCVDADAKFGISAASGWHGAPVEGNPIRLVQSPRLPEGLYALMSSCSTKDNAWQCRLVAGNFFAPLNEEVVVFAVNKEQETPLGVELLLPAYSEVVFQEFSLLRYPCQVLEANGETSTDVQAVSADDGLTVVYDLAGRRVWPSVKKQDEASALPPGVYITKAGGRTVKRLVR